MRDLKIVTRLDANDVSIVDIDILDGEPVFIEEASQTNDQRASLACLACKGTLPGMLEYGVSWGDVYSRTSTTIQLNNELQQQLQNYVGSSSSDTSLPQSTYNANLLQTSEGISIIIQRGGY